LPELDGKFYEAVHIALRKVPDILSEASSGSERWRHYASAAEIGIGYNDSESMFSFNGHELFFSQARLDDSGSVDGILQKHATLYDLIDRLAQSKLKTPSEKLVHDEDISRFLTERPSTLRSKGLAVLQLGFSRLLKGDLYANTTVAQVHLEQAQQQGVAVASWDAGYRFFKAEGKAIDSYLRDDRTVASPVVTQGIRTYAGQIEHTFGCLRERALKKVSDSLMIAKLNP